MGYTHYFEQKSAIPEDVWKAICADVEKLVESQSGVLCYEYDNAEQPPEVSVESGVIQFNGKEDYGHETFYLNKNRSGFNFCKTNYKPYDLSVCAMLLILAEHASDYFSLSSDGDIDSDFEEAIALYKSLYNKDPKTELIGD